MKTYVIKLIVVIASLFIPFLYVQAYAGGRSKTHDDTQSSTWLFQAGAIYLNPMNKQYDSAEYKKALGEVIPPRSIPFDSNTQVHLSATYMLADHFGVKLLLASPFSFKKSIKENNMQGAPNIAKLTTKILTPILSLNYYPLLDNSQQWQPHIGVGVVYDHFNETKLSSFTDVKYSGTGASKATFDAAAVLA